jgi:hypothetical protein
MRPILFFNHKAVSRIEKQGGAATMMAQQIISHLLGTVIILFGLACMCAAPLYIYIYNERDSAIIEIAAIISGLLLGSALVYAGARLFQIGRNRSSLCRTPTTNL